MIKVAFFDSSNLSTASDLPNLTFPPRKRNPENSDSGNYVRAFSLSAGGGRGSEVYGFPRSTTDRYDELLYNRSSAMVVNPMDGLIWDLSEDMCGHIVH